MAPSRVKILCRSTEPRLCVMAPWFGLCHLCLAAVHGPTNGSFLHALVSLSCRDLWVRHSRDLSSVRVLCSCLFACHAGRGPAQGRPRCRFVLAVDGAELCHHLQCRSLGCAVPGWGVLRTTGRSWMAAGSGRRWGMARGGLKRLAEDARGGIHCPRLTALSISLFLDDSSRSRAAGLVRELP